MRFNRAIIRRDWDGDQYREGLSTGKEILIAAAGQITSKRLLRQTKEQMDGR